MPRPKGCCELLLNCIFEILSTTVFVVHISCDLLWIAFELYLWDIEHNPTRSAHLSVPVVNCFWIVSLRYWAQPGWWRTTSEKCCELLLNCIFEILSTTGRILGRWKSLLWIAFELYLWDIEHNSQTSSCLPSGVVNCFWIVSLRYWAQHTTVWKALFQRFNAQYRKEKSAQRKSFRLRPEGLYYFYFRIVPVAGECPAFLPPFDSGKTPSCRTVCL